MAMQVWLVRFCFSFCRRIFARLSTHFCRILSSRQKPRPPTIPTLYGTTHLLTMLVHEQHLHFLHFYQGNVLIASIAPVFCGQMWQYGFTYFGTLKKTVAHMICQISYEHTPEKTHKWPPIFKHALHLCKNCLSCYAAVSRTILRAILVHSRVSTQL